MRRKISFIIVFVLLAASIFCCGCWDARELDTMSMVLGIGVDTSETENEWMYTFQINKPQSSPGGNTKQSGSSSKQKSYFCLQNTDKGIISAINTLRKSNSRELFLEHNQILVIGREYAEEGILTSIDAFVRFRELRLETWIMIAEETANEILNAKIAQENNSSLALARMMFDEKIYTESYSVTLFSYISKVQEKTTAAVLPVIAIEDIGEEEKVFKIKSLAVMKNNKYVDEMDLELVRGYSWANCDYKKTYIDVENELGSATVFIHNISCKQKAVISSDGKPGLELEIKGIFNQIESKGFKNMKPQEVLPIVTKMVNDSIAEKIQKTLSFSQNINADIFQMGYKIYRADPKIWKTIESKWESLYPESFIDAKVQMTFHDTGKSDKSLEMEGVLQ